MVQFLPRGQNCTIWPTAYLLALWLGQRSGSGYPEGKPDFPLTPAAPETLRKWNRRFGLENKIICHCRLLTVPADDGPREKLKDGVRLIQDRSFMFMVAPVSMTGYRFNASATPAPIRTPPPARLNPRRTEGRRTSEDIWPASNA